MHLLGNVTCLKQDIMSGFTTLRETGEVGRAREKRKRKSQGEFLGALPTSQMHL